jgi:ankyrin repeat protein
MPTLFTDAQGRWRTPVLSEKGIGLELRFSHPDVQDPMYMRQLSAAQLAEGEFRIELAGTELDVHRAAQLGMLEWLRAALSRDPSLVSRQKERLTLLQTAAQFDRPDIIDVLVDHGADLTDMGPGSTPLHRAVEFGSLAAARRLWSAAPIPTSATALTRRPCTTRSGRTRTGCVQPRSSWRPSTSSSNLAPTWTPATAAWGPHWIML